MSLPSASSLPPVTAYRACRSQSDSPWSRPFPPPSPPVHSPDSIRIEGPLFDGFSGTIDLSDCSAALLLGLRPPAFPNRTGSTTSCQPLPSSPGSRTWSVRTCCRSLTPGSWTSTRAIAPAHIAFPCTLLGRHSRAVISELNTAPVRSPANASPRHHWSSTHSSGPGRIATPYPVEDLTSAELTRSLPSYSMPVSPALSGCPLIGYKQGTSRLAPFVLRPVFPG